MNDKLHKLNFCKVLKNTKIPFEKNWTERPYSLNEIEEWIEQGNNYGVLGGYNKLIIIDADTKQLQEIVETKLPKTFTVKTGNNGFHYYYYCTDIIKKLVLMDKEKHLGEIQSTGSMVVGPNCTHPNGNKYLVHNEIEIQTIELSKIYSIFKDYLPSINKEFNTSFEDNLFEPFPINKILNIKKIKTQGDEVFGSNPWHGSTTGMNFWFNTKKNVGYCFRCSVGISLIKIIGLNERIVNHCTDKITQNKKRIILKQAIEKYHLKLKTKKLEQYNTDIDLRSAVLIKLQTRNKTEATGLLANSFIKNNYVYTLRHDDKTETWIYLDGIYVPQGKTYIKEFCRSLLNDAYTSHVVNQVIEKIEVDTYIEHDEFFNNDNFDEIAVKNGILNIKTRVLLPFTPTKRHFVKINAEFEKKATCENIKKFITDIIANNEDVQIVQELFGFLLYKDYFIEKAFMFNGNGRNGKSKLIELMKRFLGSANCTNIPLQQFELDKFSLNSLHNKMANLSADISFTALNETGNFKSLTGHDLITAPRKFLPPISFINFAKMIFCANELPKTDDMSIAFF